MFQQILAKIVKQSVAYNFGCRALYNLLCRESVGVHQVKCNIPTLRPYCEKIYTTFLNDRNSNNVFCVLWCSQIIYIRPYSLSTTTAFDLVLGCCSACLFEGVCRPQYFRTLLGLDQGWSVPTMDAPSVTG